LAVKILDKAVDQAIILTCCNNREGCAAENIGLTKTPASLQNQINQKLVLDKDYQDGIIVILETSRHFNN
jgi:hypothetical protein